MAKQHNTKQATCVYMLSRGREAQLAACAICGAADPKWGARPKLGRAGWAVYMSAPPVNVRAWCAQAHATYVARVAKLG